jgi:membrane protein
MTGIRQQAWSFFYNTVRKLSETDILFLAAGVAFNGLLTMIPILLLAASALGVLLNSSELALERVNSVLNTMFPPQPFATSIKESIARIITDIIAHRASLGLFGVLVLMYTATSLFDAVRSALHTVYKMPRRRSMFTSFLRHLGLLLLVFVLFLASTVAMWVASLLEALVLSVPALEQFGVLPMHAALRTMLTFVLAAVMFYVLYRYIPDTKPPKSAALISTVTTTVLWVVSGEAFSLYLTAFSSLGTIYGPYAFILVLLIWIYYSSLIFVIGAIVGQVHWERTRLRAKEV